MANNNLPPDFQEDFRRNIVSIFNGNLMFAFVFGSFAKGYGAIGHDLDTFVCLLEHDPVAEQAYLAWLAAKHGELGFRVDTAYPAEIVTVAELDQMLAELPDVALMLTGNPPKVYDYVVWTQVLSDQKLHLIGNTDTVLQYARTCGPYPQKWKNDIIDLLNQSGENPDGHLTDQEPLFFLRKMITYIEAPVRTNGAIHTGPVFLQPHND